jgi:putative FmdB family regulatory protein
MPTYEYACSSCGNTWEEIQKITEPALEVCPSCQKATAKRQISGGNFILKGGGWYADLYSSSKPKAASESSGSKTEGKAESKSETKTETKADTKKDSGSGGSSGTGTSGSGGSGSSSSGGGGGGSSTSTAAAE